MTTYSLDLLTPDELRLYDADLLEWSQMCARWGCALTWRDEQSFKRAWLVQHETQS